MQNYLNFFLNTIDRDQVNQDIQDSCSELIKLEKGVFQKITDMKSLCISVRKMYESFKPNLPLIMDLRNPSLVKRHWDRINKIIKEHDANVEDDSLKIDFEFEEELQVSLKFLLDKHIFQVKEDIREISEIASKEKGFEKILNKMRSEWKHIKFEIIAYKDTETFIMKAVEPILDKLDEDIARTMSIGSSPFIKFLEHEVVNWRTTLLRT